MIRELCVKCNKIWMGNHYIYLNGFWKLDVIIYLNMTIKHWGDVERRFFIQQFIWISWPIIWRFSMETEKKNLWKEKLKIPVPNFSSKSYNIHLFGWMLDSWMVEEALKGFQNVYSLCILSSRPVFTSYVVKERYEMLTALPTTKKS